MTMDYQFSVIVLAGPMTDDEILDAADAIANAGCTDASLRGHTEGMEIQFGRSAGSLQAAISSAVADVERAGFKVARVEMERDAVLQAG